MGKIRSWISGFVWGGMIGALATVAVGVSVVRPDLWQKLSVEKIERTINREIQSTKQRLMSETPLTPPANIPSAPAPTPGQSRVLVSNVTTATAIEQNFAPPRAFSAGDSLVIRGTNSSSDALELDLRIDDSASKDWSSRHGGMNVVMPGPFEWVVPFQGLLTQDKRPMDLNAITRIIVFTPENLPPAQIASIALEARAGQALSPTPAAASSSAGTGDVLASGTTTAPAIEKYFTPSRAFRAGDSLVIKGTNPTNGPLELDLRMDDTQSKDWGSRFGAVNNVPPGPFEWVIPFQNLVTPSKRPLDANLITRIIIFTPENAPAAQVSRVSVEARGGTAAAPASPAAAGMNRTLAANTSTATAIEQNFTPSRAFSSGDSLVIKGTNPTNGPLELDLRMDDTQSKDWGSRFGAVNMLPPGPFEWVVPFQNLATPSKRALDANAITRIILFSPENAPPAQIASMAVETRIGQRAAAPSNEVKIGQAWLKGASTTAEQDFFPPIAFGQEQELVVTGTNPNAKPITVYLRIDDVNSKNWNSRVNTTTTVPPGPFTVRSPISSWVTPGKTRLDRTQVSRIVVSVGDGEGTIKLGDVHVAGGHVLPNGAIGLRFGPPEVNAPGFETVTKDDKRLGAPARDLVRTQNDPLLSSGLNGVKTITVPWDKSPTATVSLWTEDQGEWEYMPHSLHRSFIINGKVALKEDFSPDEWVDKVFHRDLWKEAMIDGDPWAVYASRRAGLVTATVPVIDGRITVDISSDQPPNDGYIAAMVIEPGTSTAAADAVEQWRRERYAERWPLVDKPVDPALARGITLRVLPPGTKRSQHPFWDPNLPTTAAFRAARGQVVSVDFLAFSDQEDLTPKSTLSIGGGIKGDLRWGKWTYMRRGVGENALAITSDVLEGDMRMMRIAKGVPRRINASFTVPDTASGTVPVDLTLTIAGQEVKASVNVEVIPFTLPPTSTPIGYYMAAPNPDVWFPPSTQMSDMQMGCDLRALRRFGLTGLSPDFVVPTQERRERYLAQTRLARDAGFSTPFFDYVSVKLLVDRVGIQGMGENIAALVAALNAAGLPQPLWSIADEPQNLANPAADLKRLRDAIKLYVPNANISGQLNDPKDKPFLPLFDTVLVNNGYGVSAQGFADMKAQNIAPWMYNMPDLEAAAGFLLWRVGAQGYIQWHARAATADPSDPTDGREPDFMFLPLTADRCQPTATVDAMVLATSDGIMDLRMLQWLDGRAATDEKAKALRDEIAAAIPADWEAYAKAKPNLAPLRRKLMDYAASVSTP
ncbi:hypothetical protein GCM10007301_01650 [Azorhizobium oxalatiphilum]|uniref:Uncharacterized protein n=1 Tax=Azorhizobium oxalatiphilum TaxID=980631 RepID=A0A917BKP1_9HYPH|nr:hypothetical protein [Azorhizobium oxalatiphilum]GGF45835.1 hypothetical protein GCM10007301_01650 [Azorhizobium oxalatiphilum]